MERWRWEGWEWPLARPDVGGPGWRWGWSEETLPRERPARAGAGAALVLGIQAASQREQRGLTPQQKVPRLLHSVGEAAAASQSQEYPWRSWRGAAPRRGSCTALGTAQATGLVIYVTSTNLCMAQRMAGGAKWLQVFSGFCHCL